MMYCDYLKELQGRSSIQHKNGFATYQFEQDPEGNKYCYICDIYVVPEARKSNLCSDLADTIAVIAKENDCQYLIGTVVPSFNNATISLKVLLGCGFKLESSKENLILFTKEI